MKKILALIFLYLAFINSSILHAKTFGEIAEPKLIVLPLPFFGPSTGAGMTLKLLHTNIGKGTFVDMTGFATVESMLGVFTTVGQKHVPANRRFFWSATLEKLDVEQKLFGIGNAVPEEGEATYQLRSDAFSPKFGYYIFDNLKVYGKIRYVKTKLGKFKNGSHGQDQIWNSQSDKSLSTTQVGGGFEYKELDSEVRPMKGVKLNYEYSAVTPELLGNNQSYRRYFASVATYIPVTENWSQAMQVRYNSISCSAAFFKYNPIEVRGISSKRHNDCKSMVLQNEARVYYSDSWAFIPFFDIGKVSGSEKTSLHHRLHFGFGGGVRYIIKDALVVRADYGVSKGGESSFLFNYGHSF